MIVHGEQEVDLFDSFPRAREPAINERDRLTFAKQITLGLALISSAIMAGYACYPDNRALAALVISFYFTSSAKK